MDQITFKQQLNTISAVRLPMILAILSCHVVAPCIHGTPDWYFIKLIGHEIASIGVPLFFFISGLLFFVNVDKHSSIIDFVLQIGGGKMKKRFHSILLPYLLWNLIAYLFKCCVGKAEFSFMTMLSHKVYWDWNTETVGYFIYPCDGPLWFMRNLFLISLLSPIVYTVIRKTSWKLVAPLLAAGFIINTDIGYDFGMINTFLIFTMGAYFGINRITVIDKIYQYGKYIVIAFFSISIIDLLLFDITPYHANLQKIGILLGFPTMFYITRNLPSTYKQYDFPSLSMFIFCSHGFLLLPVMFIGRRLPIDSSSLIYIFNITFTALICFTCYWGMKRFVPNKIANMLMGGRI